MGELTVAILAHGLLGSALACATVGVGLGYVRRLRNGALLAYPPGLLALSGACFLVLVTPWLAPVAAALIVAPLVALVRDREALAAAVRRVTGPVAWSLAPALGLALALGRLNHGPTSRLDSSAYGDMLFYAAKLVSATQSVLPFRDLTVAGERHVFVETGWVFIGGVLSWLPWFDPILFQAASAPAFLVTAIALCAGLLLDRGRRSSRLALPAVLAVASVAYPTWIAESPPVALAVPLGFGMYALWRERLPALWLGALVAVLGVDLYLTKGFGLVPLGVVAVVAVLRDHSARLWPYVVSGIAIAAAGAVLFALTGAWLVELVRFKFLPADAAEGLWRQLETRSTQEAAPAALLAGQLLVAAALARARAHALLAVLGVSMLGNWLVGGHGLDITIGLSVLLAALFFADRPAELRAQRGLVAAAAAAFALSAWFRDIAGARAGFLLVSVLAIGLVLALVPRPRAPLLAACTTAAAIALAVGLGERRVTLTPEAYEVWQRVHDDVPKRGLVFTTLTGDVISGDQGWNYYPGLAARQIYLAGWSNSPLLVDDAERHERLAVNRRVLDGATSPRALERDGGYTGAFAVMRRSEHPPRSFRLLYRNAGFALYRIS